MSVDEIMQDSTASMHVETQFVGANNNGKCLLIIIGTLSHFLVVHQTIM